MDMKLTVAWYNVKDMDQAMRFYGETLGLAQTFAMPGWAEYGHRKGEATIGLNGSPEAASAGATVVLDVKDLEGAMKKLKAKGVEFEGDVMEVPGVVRLATFRDPFGNTLQLAQSLLA